jgi:hypothetical protein
VAGLRGGFGGKVWVDEDTRPVQSPRSPGSRVEPPAESDS